MNVRRYQYEKLLESEGTGRLSEGTVNRPNVPDCQRLNKIVYQHIYFLDELLPLPMLTLFRCGGKKVTLDMTPPIIMHVFHHILSTKVSEDTVLDPTSLN